MAAAVSVLAARLLRLPESYWAAITILVITRSSLGAALSVSWQRFVGTALGAVVGAILASQFGANVRVFAIAVFLVGLLWRRGTCRPKRIPVPRYYARDCLIRAACGSRMAAHLTGSPKFPSELG
jgi:uncharacterized membrane protein YccC